MCLQASKRQGWPFCRCCRHAVMGVTAAARLSPTPSVSGPHRQCHPLPPHPRASTAPLSLTLVCSGQNRIIILIMANKGTLAFFFPELSPGLSSAHRSVPLGSLLAALGALHVEGVRGSRTCVGGSGSSQDSRCPLPRELFSHPAASASPLIVRITAVARTGHSRCPCMWVEMFEEWGANPAEQ